MNAPQWSSINSVESPDPGSSCLSAQIIIVAEKESVACDADRDRSFLGGRGQKDHVNQDYVEAVLRAGGTPVLFPVTADPETLSGLLDRVDGLLLTGGADVDPARYGEEKTALLRRRLRPPGRDGIPALPGSLNTPDAGPGHLPRNAAAFLRLGGELYQDLASQFGRSWSIPV